MRRDIMYVGASANAGKTVFTRAHCRLLAQAGVAVAPFKPVCVGERTEQRDGVALDFRLWILGAAARTSVGVDNCPVQLLRAGRSATGMLLATGAGLGEVPLLADDTPLLPADLVPLVQDAIEVSYRRLQGTADVVLIEGAGNCADLARWADPANVFTAQLARPAVVLVSGARSGGAVSSLWGTWQLMPDALRQWVVGFALNDVRAGVALQERMAREVADRAGVRFLGSLPRCPIYEDIPPGQASALSDEEAEYDYLAGFFADHIDVEYINQAAALVSPR